MGKKVLIVAAHPDDEALGCAGTMARHAAEGDKVYVIYMTNGVEARGNNETEVKKRKEAALESCEILGANPYRFFDFPDNRMDTVALLDVVQSVEEVIREIQPEVVYTHHVGDLNVDHQITHKAVMTACRPVPGFCVHEIYVFEVLSSTEWKGGTNENLFHPNVFIDIGNFLDKKEASLKAYSNEMRGEPHSRSIGNTLNLCKVRGASIGAIGAESYMCMRVIR